MNAVQAAVLLIAVFAFGMGYCTAKAAPTLELEHHAATLVEVKLCGGTVYIGFLDGQVQIATASQIHELDSMKAYFMTIMQYIKRDVNGIPQSAYWNLEGHVVCLEGERSL